MLSPNQENETTRLPVEWREITLDKTMPEPSFVRTGVIGDGSCIFHAILSSYSNKYIRLSREEKIKHVQQLRNMLPEMLTRDLWANLGKGEIARVHFNQCLIEMIEKVYCRILDNNADSLTGIEDVDEFVAQNMDVCKLIGYSVSVQNIHDHVLGKYPLERDVYFDAHNVVKYTKRYFKQKYGKNLNEKDEMKFMLILEKLVELYHHMCKASIIVAYEHYQNHLKDYNNWISIEYIGFISDVFSVNIYFIDGKTLRPYIFGDTKLFKYDKSIILVWVDESHFEIVGVIEDESIRRTFDSSEPIIQTIHQYSIHGHEGED